MYLYAFIQNIYGDCFPTLQGEIARNPYIQFEIIRRMKDNYI